ncbi:hypothetical protein VI03_30095 [Burkholderia vietnamiensis]|nr:hypothetical protein VI03_30095 [Burkholderia vietnamiensis]
MVCPCLVNFCLLAQTIKQFLLVALSRFVDHFLTDTLLELGKRWSITFSFIFKPHNDKIFVDHNRR